MRAVRYREFGGPEKLQIEQIAQPELDDENVLIQITRAGVSPLDDKVDAASLVAGAGYLTAWLALTKVADPQT
jgi:D-arabinose 1-dehydrogenase-like Zn-dependent alcohol dehydrogenase